MVAVDLGEGARRGDVACEVGVVGDAGAFAVAAERRADCGAYFLDAATDRGVVFHSALRGRYCCGVKVVVADLV